MDNLKNFFEKINDKNNEITLTAEMHSDDIIIIKGDGSIDTYNSDIIRDSILDLINNTSIENIIFDFSGIRYISSTGIGTFTVLLKRIEKLNRNFFLLNMDSKLLEILSLLGLSKFFNLIKRIEDIRNNPKIFPKNEVCPHCAVLLNIIKPGRFRCTACKNSFEVTEKGQIKA